MTRSDERPAVVVVGGGVAGLSAATFTARADVATTVVTGGESILERNAHLENYPGFPAGVNPRLLLELCADGASEAGARLREGRVERVERADGGFRVELADGDALAATHVVAASWADVDYLDPLDVDLIDRGSKDFVEADETGRTGVEGLYAAGRLAEQYHQAIVAAGHGAATAITLLEDLDEPFYHDWTAPEGYFTGRGREVPPGCEEIDEAERRRRERASVERMREYFEGLHGSEPTMHPAVEDGG